MSDTLSKLEELEEHNAEDQQESTVKPFKKFQEEAIVSLALDIPDFFASVSQFIKPDLFARGETKYVIAEILNLYEKYNTIPTRAMLRDHIESKLTIDDPFEDIFKIVDRKVDYREVPIIKDLLLDWARKKAFGLIYTSEAVDAFKDGNYEHIENILKEANKIVDFGNNAGLWFFENLDILFQKDLIEHKTTGFPRLDKILNNGGPSAKEVVCWLAATNVGKSILLCNNAIASLKGPNADGSLGQDVLLITYEMDVFKIAMRCLAAIANVPQDQLLDHEDMIKRMVKSLQNTYKKRFLIYEYPPDECSVDHIYALLANLKRTKGWKPDVIILDYMDLMVSRVKKYNDNEYTRQKHVATEIRGLAKNENVLVFTATQTNRGGMDNELVDLNKAAESFGKQFALDYVISLNQSIDERNSDPAQLRFFIAKNRNGAKHQTITCEIDYKTMVVKESPLQRLEIDGQPLIKTKKHSAE